MANASEEDTRHALQYWGQLLKTDSIGPTPKLERLLKGIAVCIRNTFGDSDSPDLTPTQLLQYYRSVNGNYDKLFTLKSESLVIIYTKLRCLYSLQPDEDNDNFEAPSIPALKPAGWVKWSCVQLLLGPTEHAMFLQNTLHRYDVKDPDTGEIFPKLLPRQLFPREPHEMMVRWHQDAGNELDHYSESERSKHDNMRPSLDRSNDSGRARKQDAAQYFSNPQYRDKDGKPTIVKRLSMMGTVALNFVKDVFDPDLFGGPPRRHSQKDEHVIYGSPESTEQLLPSPRRRSKQQSKVFRQVQWDGESSGSDDQYDSRLKARLCRHRSHEPVSSPREYPQACPQSPYKSRPPKMSGLNRVRNDTNTSSYSPRHIVDHSNNMQSSGKSQRVQEGYFNMQPRADPEPAQGHSTQHMDQERQLLDTESEIGLIPSSRLPQAAPYRDHTGPPPPRAPPRKARPEVRRVATPVKGVHGRVYPNEAGAFWRRK